MINTSFIHAYDDVAKAEALYMEEMSDIKAIISPVELMERKRNEMLSIGIFEESADEYFTEGAKEAITKLGQKIIAIVNRIKEFIKNIPNMFQNGKWSKSDLDQKMEMIRKNDPKRYDELKVYVDKGSLDFASMKTMTDYYKNVDDLLDELKKKDASEKSLRAKLEKVKKFIVSNKEPITVISTAIGIVSTGTILYINYKKHKAKAYDYLVAQTQMEAAKASNCANKIKETAKYLESKADEADANTRGVCAYHTRQALLAEAALNVEKEAEGNATKLTKLRYSLAVKFDKAAGAILRKENLNTSDIRDVTEKLRDEERNWNGVVGRKNKKLAAMDSAVTPSKKKKKHYDNNYDFKPKNKPDGSKKKKDKKNKD